MRSTIRVAVLAAALLAGLAFAGSALASFAPKLTVKSAAQAPGSAGVTVSVNVGNSDDPTAKVQIYVPTGYQVNTSVAAGTKLGDITATAAAADLAGAVLPLTGELDVIPPNAAAQMACGVAAAAATWDLHLTAAGQTLDVPLYVVATAGAEQMIGPFKLVVCLPPPDVPVGTPGRATFGAKLLSATFTSSAFTSPAAAGDFRWTSLWTPYNPGVGTVNAAGTVETQSVVHAPTQDKLTVTRKRLVSYVKVGGKRHKVVKTRVTWSTSVTANGQAVTGATVTTTANGKKVGGASGSLILRKGSVTLVSKAVTPGQDLGASGCVATAIFGGLPCIDAIVGGVTVSATARAKAFTS